MQVGYDLHSFLCSLYNILDCGLRSSEQTMERLGCINEEKENQLLEVHQTEPVVLYFGADFDVD